MSERSLIRALRAVAVVGATMAVLSLVATVAMGQLVPAATTGSIIVTLAGTFFAVFAWLVAPRQARNPVVWILAIVGLLAGISLVGYPPAIWLVRDDPRLVELVVTDQVAGSALPPAAAWVLALSSPAWVGVVFTLLTFGLLLFPDGTFPSPAWRWVGVLAAVGIVWGAIGFGSGYLPSSHTLPVEHPASVPGLGLATLAAALSLFAFVRRYRTTTGATRQQFKWILWGASVLVTVTAAGFLTLLVLPQVDDAQTVVWLLAAGVFIVSYAFAVVRYRLYDVDLVIRRTVVYGLVVGALAIVFVLGVVVIPTVLPTSNNDLIVAGTTLAVLFLFQPLRTRAQDAVDRRFYRSRYDARAVTAAFSEQLRDEVDPDVLTQEWASVVHTTMQPHTISLWVKDQTGQPAGS